MCRTSPCGHHALSLPAAVAILTSRVCRSTCRSSLASHRRDRRLSHVRRHRLGELLHADRAVAARRVGREAGAGVAARGAERAVSRARHLGVRVRAARAPAAGVAGLPARRVRDRHAHQRHRAGRPAAADPAAARGAGGVAAAADLGGADVRAGDRGRERQPVVGADVADLVPQPVVGDGRGRLRRGLRRRRGARAGGAAARRAAVGGGGAARRGERAHPAGAGDPRHARPLPHRDPRAARSGARAGAHGAGSRAARRSTARRRWRRTG